MGEWVKYFILIVLLTGFSSEFYSQDPPPPMMQTNDTTQTDSPCGEDPDDTGTGAPPPPKGLCLPINDYLLPLFLAGVALGAFQLSRLKKKQEDFENSAL
ncbi:hypothetical protein [Salinimicrobium terrae]|uniref:hypothetical protein n=1 Tax=Salinimicrobium terrae TaxID=470866 RepID=UPI0004230A73|nr:hypothetical protein [Salinimicrobium terrae]